MVRLCFFTFGAAVCSIMGYVDLSLRSNCLLGRHRTYCSERNSELEAYTRYVDKTGRRGVA